MIATERLFKVQADRGGQGGRYTDAEPLFQRSLAKRAGFVALRWKIPAAQRPIQMVLLRAIGKRQLDSYLQRRGVPRKPADLVNHVCIVTVPSSPWPFHTREGTESPKILPRVTSDNGEAALQLALDGVGVARLADVIVGEAIRRGQLVQLLADAHKRELVPLSAVYVPGRHRLPKVSVFLDFLAERFGSAPWRQ